MLELTNVAAFSHPKSLGKNNEDSILLPVRIEKGFIFAIADGVGSYEGAHLASQIAIKHLSEINNISNEKEVETILLEVKNLIGELESLDINYHQAATTLTFALVDDNGLHIIHVGDSRLYLLKDLKLLCQTTDHTQHKKLLEAGLFTQRQLNKMPGKNILTTALAKNIDLEYQYKYLKHKDIVDSEGNLIVNIMSDGAYEFWESRPKFSFNTMRNPTAFSNSLQKRIEKNGALDDYSLISVKFKINEI